MSGNKWPEHYCGHHHDPKYTCPPEQWKPGGIPLNQLKPCVCTKNVHEDGCPRARTIKALMQGWKPGNRGHQ